MDSSGLLGEVPGASSARTHPAALTLRRGDVSGRRSVVSATPAREHALLASRYFCSSLTDLMPALRTTFGIGAKSSCAPKL
jgi:hypothetical protein